MSWEEKSVVELAEACAAGYGGACMELEARAEERDSLRLQLDGLEYIRRKDNEMFLSMIYAVVDGEGDGHYEGIAAMRKYVRNLRNPQREKTHEGDSHDHR